MDPTKLHTPLLQRRLITADNTKRHAWRSVHTRVRQLTPMLGRCPRVVVSTAAFHARVPGWFPGLGGLKEKNV